MQTLSPSTEAPTLIAPRFLTNDEASALLRLSPRTLEKHRVIGGGPRFRKFGRRVMYAVADLIAWADTRTFQATCDLEYLEQHGCGSRRGR
ncbi:MAG: helix-turn-helix transcriptional regulator [Janthinobacterium lividum]